MIFKTSKKDLLNLNLTLKEINELKKDILKSSIKEFKKYYKLSSREFKKIRNMLKI